MVCVGIDVSKGKSTVFAMDEHGTVHLAPKEFEHTQMAMIQLLERIHSLPGEVRVVMESTGYYHWPIHSWKAVALSVS